MLHKELRDVRELGVPANRTALPAHLADLPECLHKYGPLFDQQLAQRAADAQSAA